MKKSEKIKLSITNMHNGAYYVRIEHPTGKQDFKEVGYSLFGRAIIVTRKHELSFIDGDNDFYLTEPQFSKFLNNLIAFN